MSKANNPFDAQIQMSDLKFPIKETKQPVMVDDKAATHIGVLAFKGSNAIHVSAKIVSVNGNVDSYMLLDGREVNLKFAKPAKVSKKYLTECIEKALPEIKQKMLEKNGIVF